MNTVKAGISDNLEESVSYADVSLFMDKFMKENTFQLLEAVAEQMARAILIEFPLIREIALEIRKPQAPIPLPFASVSVCIKRSWHTVYVGKQVIHQWYELFSQVHVTSIYRPLATWLAPC